MLPISAVVFVKKLTELIAKQKIAPTSKILFGDDGSHDNAWGIITDLHQQNSCVRGLKLSRNFGHQNALLAGLLHAKDNADVVISCDADLQDDIEVFDSFINKYNQGAQIVYGARNSRSTDTYFKKHSAQGFYKFMAFLGIKLIYNHSDCRLMSKQALQVLSEYQESNLFLRGVIPQLGFKTDIAYYARQKRTAGETKYPLKKLLLFALEGLTSFSLMPIRFISVLGLSLATIGLVVFAYFLVGKFLGNPIPGYASIICSIWLIGALQLFAISIIGEYIGKTYLETKRRPRYIIEKELP
ncbi:MAG: glycosyltransferase family 2 protein [Elusimicrobiaceae bacterium]|nr:glycosyltransferase family 2 protein [Elusimicrobiaceae bacterium]